MALSKGQMSLHFALALFQQRPHIPQSPSPTGQSTGTSVIDGFERVILRQADEAKKKIAASFDTAVLKEDAEKKLAAAIPQVARRVAELSAAKQYEPALIEISHLRPAIDAFFDKVMVMVDDEDLRANRLGLLQTLVREFSSIADFSEIVTERK